MNCVFEMKIRWMEWWLSRLAWCLAGYRVPFMLRAEKWLYYAGKRWRCFGSKETWRSTRWIRAHW